MFWVISKILKKWHQQIRIIHYLFNFSQWQNWIFKVQQRAERHNFLLCTTKPSQMNCWSVLPPLSATGAQWGTPHTIDNARYIQDPFMFKWLIFFFHTIHFFFVFFDRAVGSGARMRSGIIRLHARSTNTFWNSQHPWVEPAGQLQDENIFLQLGSFSKDYVKMTCTTCLYRFTLDTLSWHHYLFTSMPVEKLGKGFSTKQNCIIFLQLKKIRTCFKILKEQNIK